MHTHHQCAPIKKTEQSNDDDMPVSAYVHSTFCVQQSRALPPAALPFMQAACIQVAVRRPRVHEQNNKYASTIALRISESWLLIIELNHPFDMACWAAHVSKQTCAQAPLCRWRQQQEVKTWSDSVEVSQLCWQQLASHCRRLCPAQICLMLKAPPAHSMLHP